MFTKVRALALAALVATGMVGATAASASVIFANGAAIIVDGPRGTADNRDNLANALGNTPGTFFELGYGGVVDFYFARDFRGPGTVVEITNGNRDTWLEGVIVQVGMTVGGVFTPGPTALPNPLLNTGNGIFTFAGGPFNTVRLTDITLTLPPTNGNSRPTGGFDVATISVSAIPLPAAGFLLIGALGGLALLRRRQAARA
jgi:hypothetical protein